jgi:hypothetical protein
MQYYSVQYFLQFISFSAMVQIYLNVDINFVTPNAVRKKKRDVLYLTTLLVAKVI